MKIKIPVTGLAHVTTSDAVSQLIEEIDAWGAEIDIHVAYYTTVYEPLRAESGKSGYYNGKKAYVILTIEPHDHLMCALKWNAIAYKG